MKKRGFPKRRVVSSFANESALPDGDDDAGTWQATGAESRSAPGATRFCSCFDGESAGEVDERAVKLGRGEVIIISAGEKNIASPTRANMPAVTYAPPEYPPDKKD